MFSARPIQPLSLILLLLLGSQLGAATLVSRWSLDEASGSTTVIDSVSGHNGTATGSPILGIPGVAGTAASLPSGSNYFQTAPTTDFELSDYTFSFWFNPLSSGSAAYTSIFSNRIGENGFIVYLHNNDTVQFWQRRTTGGWQQQSVAVARGTDQWYHVVGSFDSATGDKKFYVTPQSAGVASAPLVLGGSDILLSGGAPRVGIGALGNGTRPLEGGYIDEIQLYDSALADFQVDVLFQNPGSIVPEPSRAALVLLGVLGLAVQRRRRVS